ncbi:MAG: phosphoribosylanthranilate isomerase [Gammaproteobacteria bacterium]|nr:MAG: phosphoribosylanthranilate isomerase [Gammaproteobacteria bacterium]
MAERAGAVTAPIMATGAPMGGRLARVSAGARTRVKICGITRVEDGAAACAAGADAIGLVFFSPSPRAVDIGQAVTIRQALPPFVTVVGLFVNATEETVAETAERVRLDLLQFHGQETRPQCEAPGLPYMKAVHVSGGTDLRQASRRYASAKALVLDTHDDELWGGSGRTFDWDLVPADIELPVVLAGGLTPANVADAIARLHPYGVDVSGGVERSPGIKDAAEIAKFIREVDRVSIAQRTG